MTANNTDSTFVRRKFTITQTLDDVLTEMAAQNYQNNVSLCLRASIEDHRTTLEGTSSDQQATQRLAMKLDALEEQHELIRTTVKSIQEHTMKPNGANTQDPSKDAGEMTDDMRHIYDVLKTGDHGLRIEDISERIDFSASRLQNALESLVDLGVIVVIGDNTRRFKLSGQHSGSNEGGIQ